MTQMISRLLPANARTESARRSIDRRLRSIHSGVRPPVNSEMSHLGRHSIAWEWLLLRNEIAQMARNSPLAAISFQTEFRLFKGNWRVLSPCLCGKRNVTIVLYKARQGCFYTIHTATILYYLLTSPLETECLRRRD